jgi:hypothetical protein
VVVAAPAQAQHDELFLIDGNSLAYRLRAAGVDRDVDRMPTNAIRFVSMLVKILTGTASRRSSRDAGASGRKELYTYRRSALAPRPAQTAVAALEGSSRRSATATCRSRATRPTT